MLCKAGKTVYNSSIKGSLLQIPYGLSQECFF
jgi:hypothetical protein